MPLIPQVEPRFSPERRLWCAVLQQAVDDLSDPINFHSARDFFVNHGNNLEIACDAVDLDPRSVRVAIARQLWQ